MSKRTQILVDPTVQWAIARRILTHWCLLLVCLISTSVMFRLLISVGDQSFYESMKAAIVAQAPLLLVMFILMPIFLRDTLQLSNRFAGPMYRLRTALGEVAGGGQGGKIKFRDGDFWLEVADDYNLVHEQLQILKSRNAELEAELEDARTAV